MGIDHWLSPRGRKAIEKMGWPEWRDWYGSPCTARLEARKHGFYRVIARQKSKLYSNVAGDVALSLLSRRAVLKLAERGIVLEPDRRAQLGWFARDELGDHLADGCFDDHNGERFLDYDEALIEATLAEDT